MLTTSCPVCGAKAHIIRTLKTCATAHAIMWQCSREACGDRRIVTLAATRINASHSTPAGQIEAPVQAAGTGAPSRASQRRKRRLLAKNKGKMPSATQ